MIDASIGDWPSFISLTLTNSDAQKVEAIARSYVPHFLVTNKLDREQCSSSSSSSSSSLTASLVGQKRSYEAVIASTDVSNVTSSFVLHDRASLHVSLSKHFVLRHHQISSFVERLGHALVPVFHSKLSITVDSNHMQILHNEDKTRSYLVLMISDHHHDGMLKQLIQATNEVLHAFNAPSYYENPMFHVSIGYVPYNEGLQIIPPSMTTINDGDKMSDVASTRTTTITTNEEEMSGKKTFVGYAAAIADRYCCFDDGEEEEEEEEEKKEKREVKGDRMSLTNNGLMDTETSAVLTLRTIECNIGNKIYRLSAGSGSDVRAAAGRPTANKRLFEEIL